MSTSEPIKPRPPAERDEPCPRDLGGPGGLKCVLPYGHEVHWNGRGDVWTTAIDAIEEAAERRGWAQAVEALRDEALWRSRRGTMSHPPHSMAVWMADYLDSIDRPEYPLASNFTDRAAALTEEPK